MKTYGKKEFALIGLLVLVFGLMNIGLVVSEESAGNEALGYFGAFFCIGGIAFFAHSLAIK